MASAQQQERKRPSTPDAMPEHMRHERWQAQPHAVEDVRGRTEGVSVSPSSWAVKTASLAADAVPHAARRASQVTHAHWHCDDDCRSSSSSSGSEATAVPPCCSRWRECALCGVCVHDAQLVRRIHDEDGAAVDVVSTRQYCDGEEGGGGDVQRLVVYKTYNADRSLDYLVQEEVALLRRLSGRCHIVELLDTFTDADGNTVLVMPFVSDDWTPTRPSDVRAYMRQLLECLAFLHDQCGVIHRNVKRANVLFSGAGVLTLIDFEGSCTHSTGAVYTRIGNNLYRAPELVAAKPAHGHAASVYVYNAFDDVMSPAAVSGPPADVFGAGVVFAELLFGLRRLFDVDCLDDSYAALRDAMGALHERQQHALLHSRPLPDPRTAFATQLRAGGSPAVARCTSDAADLLARMLCWDPEARVTAADALGHPYFTSPGADAADDAAYAAAHELAAELKRKRGRDSGEAHRARRHKGDI